MSRRKQHKPRHFDSVPGETEGEPGLPELSEAVISAPSSPGSSDGAPESLVDDTYTSSVMPHTQDRDMPVPMDDVPPRCDTPTNGHVCRVCCAEFYQLADFLEHSKDCGASDVLCYPSDTHKDVPDHSEPHSPATAHDPDPDPAAIDDLHNDAILRLRSLTQVGPGLDYSPTADTGLKLVDSHYESKRDELEETELGMEDAQMEDCYGEEGEEDMEDDYEDYEDYDEDIGSPEAPAQPDLFPGQFPPGMSPQVQLSMMQASCNVKLQSLENTKVAVAQFAENNINPSDIASLQSTLYGLQQQQMFQLQLLQQIQQQILTAGLQSLPPATIQALSSGMLPAALPNMAAIAQLTMSQKSAAPDAKSLVPTVDTKPVADTKVTPEGDTPVEEPATVKAPAATSYSMSSSLNSLVALSTASTTAPPTSPSVIDARASSKSSTPVPPSHRLPSIPPLSAIGAPIFSTVVPEMSQLSALDKASSDSGSNNLGGTCLDRSQYAADDPFFKHKCRFCHKVFGSDSALQIHIRSHTGERPFKCNVCGNRFSTKGNLKVHFQRHKEKYPHLEMDGAPFPEVLDGAPPPLLMSTPPSGLGLRPPLLPPTSIPPPLVPVPSSLPTSLPPSLPTSLSSPKVTVHRDSHDTGRDPNRTPPKMEKIPDGLRPGASPMERLCAMPMPSMRSFEEKLNPSTTPKIKEERLEKVNKIESPEKKDLPNRSDSVTSEKSSASRTPAVTPTSSASGHHPANPLRALHPGFLGPLGHGSMPGHPAMSLPGPIMNFPFPGLNSHPGFGHIPPPPFGFESSFSPRPSILPTKAEDPMDQYMECQKSETSKLEALVKNIETKLTDPNQCAICHRILSCKSALQMHYRTHTGERPFKCKICSRAFTTKGNLKTHMGVHRAKPPLRMMHQCPVCHKQFTNALVLQQHIRMHTGEIPKELSVTGPDMMLPGPMPYMPFPGFPFFPPSMPPPHHGLGVELDLRKPSKMSPGALNHKQEERSHEGKKLGDGNSLLQNSGERSSEDDRGSLDPVDDMHSDEEDYYEPERSMAIESRGRDMPSDIDDSPRSREAKFSGSDHSDPDMKIEREKSPFCHMTSTPQPAKKMRCESPSSKPIMDFGPYGGFGPDKFPPTSSYSTSLMALEDHVKGINSLESSQFGLRPLEQMENIVRHADGHVTPPVPHQLQNGHASSNRSPAMPHLANERHGRTPLESNSPAGQVSPALSEGKASHSSENSQQANHLASSPGAPDYDEFGPMNLSSSDFEQATGKPHTTCNVCFKTFACRSALDIHYRSHTKERPYLCELCDRSFSTRGNMKQHMLTHKSGDLNDSMNSSSNHSSCVDYKAELTPPSSVAPPPVLSQPTTPVHVSQPTKTSPMETSSHKVLPNQSSPFVRQPSLKHVCQVCNKPFSSASALQIHMRTHTGDKPFKCNVCGKAFTTKGNLKVHMGTHMWNNGPSRRGRRMSVEGIPGLQMPPRDAEFFKAFAHRPPVDLFPFPYPAGFPNGFGPKMNEISVIQNLSGSMSQLPPTSAAESMMSHISMLKGNGAHPALSLPKLDSRRPIVSHAETLLKAEAMLKAEDSLKRNDLKVKSETNNNSYPVLGSSGELDLSVRKPKCVTPPPAKHIKSEQHTPKHQPSVTSMSPTSNPWLWKTTCHLCNYVCTSHGALEDHMKSHLPRSKEESAPKSVMT